MSAKTVRAGRAEVEIGVKDRMQAGLDAASKRLRSFGMGAARIGAVVTGAGAAVLTPLLAAAQAFASAGDAVDKMAARTGMSTEAVSELGHVANLTGTTIASLENAVKRMQQSLANDSPALRNLGIDAKALAGLKPEDQLAAIAERFAAIDDPAQRTAAAMAIFGRAGTDLIPMLSQGSAGIAKMRQEAQSLGLSMDRDTATAGAELTDALARMRSAANAAWITIGAALAPTLTSLINPIAQIIGRLSLWIRENAGLIKILAAVGAGLVAAGTVISVIAGGALAASFALAGLKIAIGAVAAIFAALTSPVGLAITLIAGATFAFLRFTEAGQNMWRNIQDALGRMWNWIKSVFEGIYKAVGAGDLELAASIAWSAVLAVIANAVDWIIGVMDGLRGTFGATFGAVLDLIRTGDWQGAAELAMSALSAAWHTGIANLMQTWGSYIRAVVETFAGAMSQVAKLWVSTQGGISKGILSLAQNDGIVGDIMAKVLGVDVREEARRAQRLDAALGIRGGSVGDAMSADIDRQTQASRDAIDDFLGQTMSDFTAWQDGAQNRADAANQDLADKITAASNQAETEPTWAERQNEELRQLLERADVVAKENDEQAAPDLDLDGALRQAAALPALATSSSWAVKAIAATGAAVRSPDEQIAANTAETNRHLAEMNERDKTRKRAVFK